MRTSALEREMTRNNLQDRPSTNNESILSKLAQWDDDIELSKAIEEYYKDHQLWTRKRVETRRKESDKDQRDRELEERENNRDKNRAAALADSFLDEMGAKVNSDGLSIAPQPLRLRMTRENVRMAPASPAKRTVEEVEGLLEEDEDEDYQTRSKKKRTLIPLEYDGEESRQDDPSKESQLRALVSSIPSDTKGLWEYTVYWEGLDTVTTLCCVANFRL
jgi:hypothetical protein